MRASAHLYIDDNNIDIAINMYITIELENTIQACKRPKSS